MSNTSTSRLEDKAVDILDRLDSLTSSYAPEVMESAVQATMISGVNDIFNGLIGLLCAYGVWFSTKKLVMFFVDRKKKDGYFSDWEWEVGYTLAYVVGLSVCVIVAIGTIWSLFDIWNWVAIFHPELALAHKILGL